MKDWLKIRLVGIPGVLGLSLMMDYFTSRTEFLWFGAFVAFIVYRPFGVTKGR